MEFKTTKKQIKDNYSSILKIGYCELQALLSYESPIAYNAGVYGWNCDFYKLNDVIICEGYRPIGQKVDYNLVRETESRAEKIKYNNMLTSEERRAQMTELLNDFIKQATNKQN